MKPDDPLRPLLGRLADRFSSAEGGVVLRQLQMLGQAIGAAAPGAAPRSPPAAPANQVGIWEARDGPQGREFVRNRRHYHFWRAAADVERIPPKGDRKRIILFGESAARGLYYDPAYTPAGVLQVALDRMGGSFEVVDLAITALWPLQMMGLIRQVAALKPDALVLFGGNNWHCEFDREPSAGNAGALATAFGKGLGEYREEAERRVLGGLAERVLGVLAATAKALAIPAVVVVPEFNLADWCDNVPPPIGRTGPTGEWHRLREEAEAACARSEWDEAGRIASRMREIDGGLAPAASRILGRIALARGSRAVARSHFEAARDALAGLPYWSCPRCLSSTQAILRAAGTRHGMSVVDLPRIIEAAGEIPGRRFFLDYCHMSSVGIVTAMGALAPVVSAAVAPGSAPGTVGAADPSTLPVPEPGVAAAAHVLAAIHNSILGQPAEIVAHHCREGLRLDPKAAELLRAFLCARALEVPDWLDGDLAAACSPPNARRHLIRSINPAEGRHFPHQLLDLAGEFLPAETLRSCRLTIRGAMEVSRHDRRIDLLDPRFQEASLHLRRTGFHAEKNPRSDFRFPCPNAGEIRASLCIRTPGAADPAQVVTLVFGGEAVWSGHVGPSWCRVEASFATGEAAGGFGILSVRWPQPAAAATAAIEAARDSADRGEAPDVYLTFGEIHSLFVDW